MGSRVHKKGCVWTRDSPKVRQRWPTAKLLQRPEGRQAGRIGAETNARAGASWKECAARVRTEKEKGARGTGKLLAGRSSRRRHGIITALRLASPAAVTA